MHCITYTNNKALPTVLGHVYIICNTPGACLCIRNSKYAVHTWYVYLHPDYVMCVCLFRGL